MVLRFVQKIIFHCYGHALNLAAIYSDTIKAASLVSVIANRSVIRSYEKKF